MYFYPGFNSFFIWRLIEAHGRQRMNTRTALPVHYESLILYILRAVINCFIEDVWLAWILSFELGKT